MALRAALRGPGSFPRSARRSPRSSWKLLGVLGSQPIVGSPESAAARFWARVAEGVGEVVDEVEGGGELLGHAGEERDASEDSRWWTRNWRWASSGETSKRRAPRPMCSRARLGSASWPRSRRPIRRWRVGGLRRGCARTLPRAVTTKGKSVAAAPRLARPGLGGQESHLHRRTQVLREGILAAAGHGGEWWTDRTKAPRLAARNTSRRPGSARDLSACSSALGKRAHLSRRSAATTMLQRAPSIR